MSPSASPSGSWLGPPGYQAEIGLMSLLVYAGTAQFIGVGMLGPGMAPPAIISTTFLVNLRHPLHRPGAIDAGQHRLEECPLGLWHHR